MMLLFVSSFCSAYTQVSGTIEEIYVNETGAVAIKLDEGFTQQAINECATFNGYAGNRTADPALKSLLLAAYSSKSRVKLGVNGCDGNWLKITDVRGY